jgi:hypothetical protein
MCLVLLVAAVLTASVAAMAGPEDQKIDDVGRATTWRDWSSTQTCIGCWSDLEWTTFHPTKRMERSPQDRKAN